MRAALMIVTVIYSSKWTKVEVTRIVGLKGQKIPGKTMLELKTNCARSKTFMRAEEEEKKLGRTYGFKVLEGSSRKPNPCRKRRNHSNSDKLGKAKYQALAVGISCKDREHPDRPLVDSRGSGCYPKCVRCVRGGREGVQVCTPNPCRWYAIP